MSGEKTTYTVEWTTRKGTPLCCESVPVTDVAEMVESIEEHGGEIRHLNAVQS
jgi:hypothetical protein